MGGRAGQGQVLPSALFIVQRVISGEVAETLMAVWHQLLSVLTELLIGTQGHQEASLEKCGEMCLRLQKGLWREREAGGAESISYCP